MSECSKSNHLFVQSGAFDLCVPYIAVSEDDQFLKE